MSHQTDTKPWSSATHSVIVPKCQAMAVAMESKWQSTGVNAFHRNSAACGAGRMLHRVNRDCVSAATNPEYGVRHARAWALYSGSWR